MCDGVCVDVSIDPLRCGGCDHNCQGLPCSGGECVSVEQIALGNTHSCALLADGTVRCWGGNSVGQLGNGENDFAGEEIPQVVSGVSDATQIAAGGNLTCAVVGARKVKCWGNAFVYSDLEPLPPLVPVEVPELTNVAEVAVGAFHSCARLEDKSVKCWGSNFYGQLGNGTIDDQGTIRPAAVGMPVTVVGLNDAEEIALGGLHSCARRTGGLLTCWGSNLFGEFDGTSYVVHSEPVLIQQLSGVSQVTTGFFYTCVRIGSAVRCVGLNDVGQLGNSIRGSVGWAASLALPPVLDNVAEVRSGFDHTCARSIDGSVRCWGWNGDGQLGNSLMPFSSTPVIATIIGVRQIALGWQHTCVLRNDGRVRCWGREGRGQLGRGASGTRSTPVPITSLPNVVELAAGGATSCARLGNGEIHCWGFNGEGGLGDGTGRTRFYPLPVLDTAERPIDSARAVALGGFHGCAVVDDEGRARCWGSNQLGQLGDGTFDSSSGLPVFVQGITGVATLALGSRHSCALRTNQILRCWGDNRRGQLGIGSAAEESRNRPATVADLTGVEEVALGDEHSCARLADGTLQCWGDNNRGQLGVDSADREVLSPAPVENLDGEVLDSVVDISVGGQHTCAALSDGRALCWGDNEHGQLGDGSRQQPFAPILVGGLEGVIQVAAGKSHTCALLSNKMVHCWGDNRDGQLGDGSQLTRTTAAPVVGLANVEQIVAGSAHNCALRDDGEVYCWGSNFNQQTGSPAPQVFVEWGPAPRGGAVVTPTPSPSGATKTPTSGATRSPTSSVIGPSLP